MSNNVLLQEFATFKPKGYISAANAEKFLQEITREVESEKTVPLLVDMKGVEFMDSAGLMSLIKGFRLAQELGRDFKICSVSPSVKILFELTQLDRVFKIVEDRDNFTTRTYVTYIK